jgi:DNA-binding IscR family transcriptional regulator
LTILTTYSIIKVVNGTDAYRLEALMELAAAYPASLTVKEVARRRDIPPKFLARLLGELAREELVVTARGPHGGVRLAAPPEAIGLGQLLLPEPPPETGGAAVRWLAARLAEVQQELLASLKLAGLVKVEREQGTIPSFEI